MGLGDFSVWLLDPEEPGDAAIGLEAAQVASIDEPASHVTTTTTENHARGKYHAPASRRGATLRGQQSQTSRSLIHGAPVSASLLADGKATTDNNMTPGHIAQPAPRKNSPDAGGMQTRWRGGRMTKLVSAYNSQQTIALLAQWIRSIHRWGTTAYAGAVERDIMGQETPVGVTIDEGRAQGDLQCSIP
ncbi:hypothetical protein DL546_006162 [Coniochaeta pulveracea]|uniref:Uncharacterized protein n=1 Tax=Coniochaeta pulveracea TaxID=177199 RepID=A0A420Y5W8_9PEZI|nr:hypothetical protein DL546_006162 [Coniochaeta pulveracea]